MDFGSRVRVGVFAGLALLVMSAGCGLGPQVTGSGHSVEEERQTADFQALEVNNGIAAVVVVDAAQPRKVRLVGDDNLVARMRTDLEGGRTLHVYFPQEEVGGWSSPNSLRVEVTVPSLEAITRSGGGTVDVSGSNSAASFSVSASGGGKVRVGGLDTASFSMDVSGGTDVVLAGRATTVSSSMSGGSTLDARDFSAREAHLASSGGGSTVMRVAEKLDVEASGGGEVRILGRPTVLTQNLSGGSTLTFE